MRSSEPVRPFESPELEFEAALELELPRMRALLRRQGEAPSSSPPPLLVLGGRAPDPDWLRKVSLGRETWALDRGADACRAAGVVPSRILGDFDSVSDGARKWAKRTGCGGSNTKSIPPLGANQRRYIKPRLRSASLRTTSARMRRSPSCSQRDSVRAESGRNALSMSMMVIACRHPLLTSGRFFPFIASKYFLCANSAEYAS